MRAVLRAIPATPDARSPGILGLMLLLALFVGAGAGLSTTAHADADGSVDADEAQATDAGADALPGATALTKVTWSRASGVTRVEFHGSLLPLPRGERSSTMALRLDFAATDAESIPRTLDVGSPEVASIVRIPASTGILPEGVSCRFVVVLARPDVAHSLDGGSDGVILLVGDTESIGRGEEAPAGESVLALPLSEPRVAEQPPELAEVLERPQSIRVNTGMSLRAAPSAIAMVIGMVDAGQSRVIDARRGEWVHVQAGGWLRLPQVVGPVAMATSDAAMLLDRTPVAFSVVTLGTNLDILVEEILPGDAKAALLEQLYAVPIRMARFRVRVDPATPYAFRLPSKDGRLILEFADGAKQQSLDPTSLALRDSGARARIDLLLAAPPLAAGGSWETLLVFPASVDFLKITDARVEVNGFLHRLFRVPGSGLAPHP